MADTFELGCISLLILAAAFSGSTVIASHMGVLKEHPLPPTAKTVIAMTELQKSKTIRVDVQCLNYIKDKYGQLGYILKSRSNYKLFDSSNQNGTVTFYWSATSADSTSIDTVTSGCAVKDGKITRYSLQRPLDYGKDLVFNIE